MFKIFLLMAVLALVSCAPGVEKPETPQQMQDVVAPPAPLRGQFPPNGRLVARAILKPEAMEASADLADGTPTDDAENLEKSETFWHHYGYYPRYYHYYPDYYYNHYYNYYW